MIRLLSSLAHESLAVMPKLRAVMPKILLRPCRAYTPQLPTMLVKKRLRVENHLFADATSPGSETVDH